MEPSLEPRAVCPGRDLPRLGAPPAGYVIVRKSSTPLFLDDDRGEEEIRWLARQATAWAAAYFAFSRQRRQAGCNSETGRFE